MSSGNKQQQTEREFDQFEESYEETLDGSVKFIGAGGDFFTQVKADEIVQIAEQTLNIETKSLKVLDVGSGPAIIHKFLDGKFSALVGVDISSGMVAAAQRNNPSNDYLLYDGSRLPFEDGSFDIAYTICVMHHVPTAQWQQYLSEMRRVVKAGGLVIVIEHNPYNPLTRHVVNNCEFDENAVLLSCSRLQGLFKSAGFQNEFHRFILFTPFPSKWFRWLDAKLRWLPLGAQYCMVGQK